MNRRRIIIIMAAIVLAVFGMLVILAYVNSAEQRAREGDELVQVLVATDDIEANTPAAQLDPRTNLIEVPARLKQEDAIIDLGNLGNQVTMSPIRGGEQIVERQFGAPDTVPSPARGQIERGKEIVTVGLEPQRAVGGRLSAGDTVSVIVSAQSQAQAGGEGTQGGETAVVLNQIPVTAVTGGATDENGQASDVVLVSLGVRGREAERIVYGMEHGTIWLTLNGEAVQPVDSDTVDGDDIYDGRQEGS